MEEIIKKWEENSKENEESNFLFIRSLKMLDGKVVDKLAGQLHEEAFEKINCLDCGNCCKNSKPRLDDNDIHEIAKFKNLSVAELKKNYLELDEEQEWSFNSLPCPFLGLNNECQIYDSRPKDCREFPHTNKPGFASRSYSLSSNTTICPAVYFIVENLQKVLDKTS